MAGKPNAVSDEAVEAAVNTILASGYFRPIASRETLRLLMRGILEANVNTAADNSRFPLKLGSRISG